VLELVKTGLTNRDVLLVVDLAGCKEPRVRSGSSSPHVKGQV